MLLPSTAKTLSLCRKAASRVCCTSPQFDPLSMRAMRSNGEAAEAGGEAWNMFPLMLVESAMARPMDFERT